MKRTDYYGPDKMPDAARIQSAEEICKDYNLTDPEAVTLMALCLMAPAERLDIMREYIKKGGIESLLNLFAQFMGLANSVAANAKEAAGDLLLQNGANIHPHEVEKINMPSIFGALNGVRLSNSVGDAKTCAGCAYRKGAWANQCASTTIDAEHCQADGTDFLCHEDLLNGEPHHKCIGYATFIKKNPVL